jgi:hypothetical protein
MSMKISNDTIGDRTRDLLVCSAVPQPTAPPAACPSSTVRTCNKTMTQYHSAHRMLYLIACITSVRDTYVCMTRSYWLSSFQADGFALCLCPELTQHNAQLLPFFGYNTIEGSNNQATRSLFPSDLLYTSSHSLFARLNGNANVILSDTITNSDQQTHYHCKIQHNCLFF